jgi:hypothetical protein
MLAQDYFEDGLEWHAKTNFKFFPKQSLSEFYEKVLQVTGDKEREEREREGEEVERDARVLPLSCPGNECSGGSKVSTKPCEK